MKKFVMFFVITTILFCWAIYGEKVATLPELMKPSVSFAVDETQMYVPEGATIFIYSKKDYKLVKKFGREGEGPKEFKIIPEVPLSVTPKGDQLIVNSLLKISYFTKNGEIIKEIKALSQGFFFQPFGDKFVGLSTTQENKMLFYTYNFYDAKLNKTKEIYRAKHKFQGPGNGFQAVQKVFTCFAYKDNTIIMPGKDDATLDILNKELKKLFSIQIEQEKLAVDQKFKDKFMAELKSNPATKNILGLLKPIKFPKYFPTIMAFFVEDDIIYIMTFKTVKGNYEFFTYDINGKFKKKITIPIKFQTELTPYPITIYKQKLYQIVENEEEEWELYVTKIF
jgi:hypothetical protein